MRIEISRTAARSLTRSNKRKLIAAKIAQLTTDREGLSANIIQLKGRDAFRLRVQDWRIIFREEADVIYIDEIEPRGSIYEDRT